MKLFSDYSLSEPILKSISEQGFTNPSPIQHETLSLLLNKDHDLIGLAATGTGKTAAFTIPLLERIDVTDLSTQAFILCPTRELASQVASQVAALGKHLKVKLATLYGGAGYREQMQDLKKGAHVVIGTPGRMIDHISRGSLKLSNVHTVVLDEADEMISMGFKEDLENILAATQPENRNIWLFSATMSPDLFKVADQYLVSPHKIQMNKVEKLPDALEQVYFMTTDHQREPLLERLIECADQFYGLIFCQTKALCMDLTERLRAKGYAVDCLHGDMDQPARERALISFKKKKVSILICTDVAARGIDVKDITHVINYSLPRELDNYVHRIGRTARNGAQGFAYSLVTPSHKGLISKIEKMTKSQMKLGVPPSADELVSKKMDTYLESFKASKTSESIKNTIARDWTETLEALDKTEIVAKFIALQTKGALENQTNFTQTQGSSQKDFSVKRKRGDRDRKFSKGGRRDRGENRGDRSFNGSQSRKRQFGEASSDKPKFERSGFSKSFGQGEFVKTKRRPAASRDFTTSAPKRPTSGFRPENRAFKAH